MRCSLLLWPWFYLDFTYMCFIQTLIITCTVSEILAQIDHKDPNWTFLALHKGHLYWFRSLHISSQYWHHPNEIAWCKINGQHFSTAESFLIIWLKLRKMQNQTLPTLKAIQSYPSFDSSLVPSLGSFMHTEKKLLKSFWINGQYMSKWVKNS